MKTSYSRWGRLALGLFVASTWGNAEAKADVERAAPAALRLNHIQVLGTHNSYHLAPRSPLLRWLQEHLPNAESWAYDQAPIAEQLEQLHVRQLEWDLFRDPDGGRFAQPLAVRAGLVANEDEREWRESGTKILHSPDFDYRTNVARLQSALEIVREWSVTNPRHVPVLILLELKSRTVGARLPRPVASAEVEAAWAAERPPLSWTEEALRALEQEILAVLPREKIVTPDDVRGAYPSLRDAITREGWPPLDEVRGKFLFALDNEDDVRLRYLALDPLLRGRLLFVSVSPEDPSAGWFKINDAVRDFARIQELVRQGFLVRTRADVDLREARTGDLTRARSAWMSGAQFISTDFPAADARYPGYRVTTPGGGAARLNPVATPAGAGATREAYSPSSSSSTNDTP